MTYKIIQHDYDIYMDLTIAIVEFDADKFSPIDCELRCGDSFMMHGEMYEIFDLEFIKLTGTTFSNRVRVTLEPVHVRR
jgi:hypothetical protein